MKYLKIALVTAFMATAANAASFFSDVSTAFAYGYNNVADSALWGGVVLGLQQDSTNEGNQCYLSYLRFVNQIDAVGPYIDSLGTTGGGSTNTIINAITDNPYYQPGNYFKIAKRVTEVGFVYYDFYK